MRTHAIVTGVLGASLLAAALTGGCGSEAGPAFSDPNADGGSSGGASGGSFGSSGGGGDGDGGGSSGGADCRPTTKKVEHLPIDMMIGLDTSLSMDFDDKWSNVRDALKLFVQNPAYADLGLGLQFFPIQKQCSVADYQVPAVGLALQAETATPIANALDLQQMAGGTPMVPILDGLSKYLAANAKPNRKPVLVLATDGFPDDNCLAPDDTTLPNTLANAVAIADRAAKGTPSVPTFVIGVGKELGALDAIAAAGGTGKATLVDVTGTDTRAAFIQALDDIRTTAIPCDYDIPAGAIDVKKTNVTYTTNGTPKQLIFVGNEAGCAKAPNDGWYFDDEAAPKKVILCAGTCDAVKKDDRGQVDLVFGCPRVEVR